MEDHREIASAKQGRLGRRYRLFTQFSLRTLLIVMTLAAAGSWWFLQPRFPLRTDKFPREWKLEEINDGLPYRWEKGSVYVLAWEVIEDDRPWKVTQVLVLKRLDQPTEKGQHRWLLAQVYHHPEDENWPWRTPFRIPPPFIPGEPTPQLTDAQVFGHEFYDKLPNDKQIEAFLSQTMWTPQLGTRPAFVLLEDEKPTITTKLTAGGIDRLLWKRPFNRDVPTALFPELKQAGSEPK